MGEAIVHKYFPTEKWEKEITTHTSTIKMIASYTKMSFSEVMELPYSLFFLYRHDAFVHNNRQTDDGREFLKALWRLQQTEPDLDAIRKMTRR